MKRLCFLFPDVAQVRSAVEVLRGEGISDASIMIVARHDVPLEDLPAESIDATDAIPGLKRGLAGGGAIGLVAGVVALRFSTIGLVLGGAAIPLFALIGAGVSGFMTMLAGSSLPNSRLKPFEDAIQHEGKVLLMVDVEPERVGAIEALIESKVPASDFAGFEPDAPLIPP